MWQRIQTLYLLISTALVASLCLGTACRIADPDGLRSISYWQLQQPYFGILLGILAFLVVLALVVYKNRIPRATMPERTARRIWRMRFL